MNVHAPCDGIHVFHIIFLLTAGPLSLKTYYHAGHVIAEWDKQFT